MVTIPMSVFSATAQVFGAFLKLGFTSFGGPVAHLGFFRTEFVERKRWMSDREYADLVALCQFLPGPASSQVGMAIGLKRAGLLGLIAAWAAFTLPSAIALTLFALGVAHLGDVSQAGWILGLMAAAVGVVAHALIGMSRSLVPDVSRAFIALGAFGVVLLVPHPLTQVGAIVVAALIAFAWLQDRATVSQSALDLGRETSVRGGLIALVLFALLLVGLPLWAWLGGGSAVSLFDSFYRAGALVFGGGHVVLPLLETETVRTGLVDQGVFLAGYGAAQVVPGPLFTFASFLGASTTSGIGHVPGATLALVAVFLPGALLVVGVIPFWDRVRRNTRVQAALLGANAAVVGILGAALVTPVITHGVISWPTALISIVVLLLLQFTRVPVWVVVPAAGLIAQFVM